MTQEKVAQADEVFPLTGAGQFAGIRETMIAVLSLHKIVNRNKYLLHPSSSHSRKRNRSGADRRSNRNHAECVFRGA